MRYDWARERAFRTDEDGCLIYRGVQSTMGWPIIRVNNKNVTVRRSLMAIIVGRPLTSRERVRVSCGKPQCCSCIYISSQRKITLEALAKHRWTDNPLYRAKMWANPGRVRKWSDAQVDDMRARELAGETRASIATLYESTVDNLQNIFRYRSRTLHLSPAVRQMVEHNRGHGSSPN